MKIRKCKYNFGNNNDGVFSTINGYATETNNFGETAVGILNKSTLDPDTFTSPDVVTSSKATLFSVGNGSDNVRKNAFEIKANGDTYINGVGGYDGTNSEDATSVGESIQSVQDSSNKFAEDIESIHIEKSATGDTYVLKVAGEDRGTITNESGVSFTPGNGLQLVDTNLSVKIDPTSESYLTAEQDGLKISGIDAKFGDYLPLSGGEMTGRISHDGSFFDSGIIGVDISGMGLSMINLFGFTSYDRTGEIGIALNSSRIDNWNNWGVVYPGMTIHTTNGLTRYSADGVTIPNKTSSDLLNAGGSTTPISNIVTQVQASIVDSAPETLDTLNELAAALGDDPNFATTVTNQIAQKADKTTATTSTDGLMSAADKTKLDSLSTVATSGSYNDLTDAPTIPTVQSGQTGTNTNYVYSSAADEDYRVLSDISCTRTGDVVKLQGRTWGMPSNSSLDLVTLPLASSSMAGLMSTTDKQKLDGLSNYTLPIASATQLGGVRVGDGLEITGEGVLNCTIDPGSGTVSWGNIQGKPTFSTVATSGLYSDLTGTPDLSNYVTSTQLTSIAGSNTYTDANYISKETNLTDAVIQLDEEIKATNDNLALEHANAEATYAKKTELSSYLPLSGGTITYEDPYNDTNINYNHIGGLGMWINGDPNSQFTHPYAALCKQGAGTSSSFNLVLINPEETKGRKGIFISTKGSYDLATSPTSYDNVCALAFGDYGMGVPNADLAITKTGIFIKNKTSSDLLNAAGGTTTLKTINGESLLGTGDFAVATDADIEALFN